MIVFRWLVGGVMVGLALAGACWKVSGERRRVFTPIERSRSFRSFARIPSGTAGASLERVRREQDHSRADTDRLSERVTALMASRGVK